MRIPAHKDSQICVNDVGSILKMQQKTLCNVQSELIFCRCECKSCDMTEKSGFHLSHSAYTKDVAYSRVQIWQETEQHEVTQWSKGNNCTVMSYFHKSFWILRLSISTLAAETWIWAYCSLATAPNAIWFSMHFAIETITPVVWSCFKQECAFYLPINAHVFIHQISAS